MPFFVPPARREIAWANAIAAATLIVIGATAIILFSHRSLVGPVRFDLSAAGVLTARIPAAPSNLYKVTSCNVTIRRTLPSGILASPPPPMDSVVLQVAYKDQQEKIHHINQVDDVAPSRAERFSAAKEIMLLMGGIPKQICSIDNTQKGP